jgi:hypothetical protein
MKVSTLNVRYLSQRRSFSEQSGFRAWGDEMFNGRNVRQPSLVLERVA